MHDQTSERDYYLETLDRIEPDIAMIDASAGWASIAISLRRIADSQEKIANILDCMWDKYKYSQQ
jgi:hypothetical protein